VAINESFGIQLVLDDETDSRAQAMEVTESPDVRYADIGGIDDQIREVREAVEDPLENPEQFEVVGIEPHRVCCCTALREPAKRCWRRQWLTKAMRPLSR